MATSNDRAILNSIINPLMPTDEFKAVADEIGKQCKCNSFISFYPTYYSVCILNPYVDNSENVKNAKEFEKQGVICAEAGKMNEALQMFNNAIGSSPMWASAYNNRAQALRLLKRNDGRFNPNNFESLSTIILAICYYEQKLWKI